MPLSEHEQRLLEQLEKQLGADDPTFAQSMSSSSRQVREASFSARHVVLGFLIALVGLGIVIAGVTTKLIFVGVAGLLVAGAGVYLASTQKSQREKTEPASAKQAKPKTSSRFMQNLEGRWDERQSRP